MCRSSVSKRLKILPSRVRVYQRPPRPSLCSPSVIAICFLACISPQMLLRQTTAATIRRPKPGDPEADHQPKQVADGERPLTCMFYFFASQMKQNIQPADTDLVRRGKMPDQPTHQLDSMLARIGMHAAHSPLISKFETFPVEIPDIPSSTSEKQKPPREQVHDTVMLMKFRDKRAREEWIVTKEWQEFMANTNGQDVFRRMPHVRCASSLRGLMDPMDSLTA